MSIISRRLLLLIATALTLAVVAIAVAKTSHAGWPVFDGKVTFAKTAGSTLTGTPKNDELLGKGGSDTIDGGAGKDVIWGDELPGTQPTSQHDRITGGDGNDIVYTSHGFNTVDTGAGNDIIHAHYGVGSINCGPGTDTLFISHKSQPHYKISSCEIISYKSAGS